MFCVQCGRQIPDNSNFCPSCGVSLASSENKSNNQPPNDEEQILMDIGANLFRGIEGVGGRLKVTSKRLVFTSHMFNLQRGITEIPISNIDHLERDKGLGLIDNQMVVVLKSGVRYKFVLNKRDTVIDTIIGVLKKQ